MANEEEGFDANSKQNTLFYQRFTKQSLYRVKKKPIKKRYIDISRYTLFKPR